MIYSLLKHMSFDDEKGWKLRGISSSNAYTTAEIKSVAFGDGKFVAVTGGRSCISTDGLNWTLDTSVKNTSIGTNPLKLIYANSYFWGVYSTYIVRSSDGITWEQMFDSTNSLAGVSSILFQDITYCFNKYIALANGYTAYSTDGINWTVDQSLKNTTWGTNRYQCNEFFNNTLYIGGDSGKIAKTTDGITWTYVTAITGAPTIYIFNVYGTKVFAYCTSGKIFSSTNMTTWTSSTLLSGNSTWASNDIRNFAKNGSTFIVTAWNANISAVSTNGGTSWTVYKLTSLYAAMGPGNLNKIIFANGYFVAVGSSGKSARSTDGITWTATTSISGVNRVWSSGNAVNSIAYDGSTYMVVGDNSSYAISSDLKKWTFLDSLITGPYTTSTIGVSSVWNVEVHNSKFVLSSGVPAGVKKLGTDNPSSIAATDSSSQYKTWIYYNSLASKYGGFSVNKHKSINSKLIYCGKYLAYSDDVFSTISLNTTVAGAIDVVYANSKYTVAAAGGLIYNGAYLDSQSMTVSNSLNSTTFGTNTPTGIAYGNGKYVVVGPNGHTAYSTDAITWTYNDKIRNSAYWGTSIRINCIIYAFDKFWIGGENGKCMSSDDGINWTAVPEVAETGYSTKINEIVFTNSRLIFCLDSSSIITYKP